MDQEREIEVPGTRRRVGFVDVLRGFVSTGIIMFVGVMIFYVVGHATLASGEPTTRVYYLADATKWYPMAEKDSVPILQVYLVYLAAFLPTIMVFELLLARRNLVFSEVLRTFLRFGFGIFGSTWITETFVDIGKVLTGSLRPDFYYRCFGPDSALPPPELFNQIVVNNEDCGYDDESQLLSYGRRSFPSGHAGISVSGCFFMVLYLLYVARRLQRPWLSQILFFLALLPLGYGFSVSISRVTDNRHYPVDIVGGALIGIVVSSIYFLWTLTLEPTPEDK